MKLMDDIKIRRVITRIVKVRMSWGRTENSGDTYARTLSTDSEINFSRRISSALLSCLRGDRKR